MSARPDITGWGELRWPPSCGSPRLTLAPVTKRLPRRRRASNHCGDRNSRRLLYGTVTVTVTGNVMDFVETTVVAATTVPGGVPVTTRVLVWVLVFVTGAKTVRVLPFSPRAGVVMRRTA